MNSPVEDNLPASERFIDAALSEHARLGCNGVDDELVHRILRETVNRSTGPTRVLITPPRDRRLWVKCGAVVAALVTLVLVALSSLEIGQKERSSDEFRFLVRYAADPELEDQPVDPAPPMREAERYLAPLDLVANATRLETAPEFLTRNIELVTSLDPSFELLPSDRRWVRQESFRITADRSRASGNRLIYEGRVVVEHLLFRIEADEVTLPAPGGSASGISHPLLARGVKVFQTSPARVAVAKDLSFDPVSGTLTLTGVHLFETSEGKLRQFATGDRLVLEGERFTVESPAEMKYAAPPLVAP